MGWGECLSPRSFILLIQAELGPWASSLTTGFTTEARTQGIWDKFCNPWSLAWVWVFDHKCSPLQSVSWGHVPGLPTYSDRVSQGRGLTLYKGVVSMYQSLCLLRTDTP